MTKIQNDRKLPGPGAPLTAERDLYLRLMAQGMSNSQACRVVGINRRTGTRWRYGRTIPNRAGLPWVYLPIATKPAVISPRYLSEQERITLADLRRTDRSIRSIATEMGRSPSTISKELRRNANAAGRYEPTALTVKPRADDLVPGQANWPGTQRSRNTCRNAWRSGGARNRSATRCRRSFRTILRGVWCTRPSIRPSTCRDGAVYVANWRCCCVLAVLGASLIADPMPDARVVSRTRW